MFRYTIRRLLQGIITVWFIATDTFIAMQKQLALRSLADPTPPRISQFWFGSHPTVLQRIGMAELQR